ncbi:MAG: hypothetical protein A2Z34_05285 [Planctomycetes bacterium RBG_16_59_8]|nr:MAG: hypothetical protein A2Z34_05285 [Planctomycetes bacterium RBG_16_59_8]
MNPYWSIVLVMSTIMLLSVGCDDTESATVSATMPTTSYEGIVGTPKHKWLYRWPHDIVPDQFDGFRIVSTPVERDKPGMGRTMMNWLMPVVLSSMEHQCEIRILCKKDYPMSTTHPWAECFQLPLSFQPVAFHSAKAGIAAKEGPPVEYVFIFLRDEVVFEITSTTREGTSVAQRLAKQIAEAVWEFNDLKKR